MITSLQFGALAESGYLKGQPYSRYDCQGYIKALFKHFGVTKKWIGTNDMYRNHCTFISAIGDLFEIPYGAYLFTVRNDGKQPSYYAAGPNCVHVGVFCGIQSNGRALYWHSTTGGVQSGSDMSRWTHWALAKDVDYYSNEDNTPLTSQILEVKPMLANRIKYHYKEDDGTEDDEILELGEDQNVTSVELYLEPAPDPDNPDDGNS